jgi:hypothetical protein
MNFQQLAASFAADSYIPGNPCEFVVKTKDQAAKLAAR